MVKRIKPFYETPKISKLDDRSNAFGSIVVDPENKCDPHGSNASEGCANGTGVGELYGFTYCADGTSGDREPRVIAVEII